MHIFAFETMFSHMHYTIIIMQWHHHKHAGQTIISKHISLYSGWHYYILVQNICHVCKNISEHAKVLFYFNIYVLV